MKKFNKIFSVIIFVFIFVSKLFSEDRAKFNTDIYDYNWPIKAKPFITSSFAEYRATHFHAGIDISTEHAIGLEVYSARDGYVAVSTTATLPFASLCNILETVRFDEVIVVAAPVIVVCFPFNCV